MRLQFTTHLVFGNVTLPGIDSLFLIILILNKLGFNLEFLVYFFNSFYFLLQDCYDIAIAMEWYQGYQDYQGYQNYQRYQGKSFGPLHQQRRFQ